MTFTKVFVYPWLNKFYQKKTRMTTFIKAKFKNWNVQTNIDKYKKAAHEILQNIKSDQNFSYSKINKLKNISLWICLRFCTLRCFVYYFFIIPYCIGSIKPDLRKEGPTLSIGRLIFKKKQSVIELENYHWVSDTQIPNWTVFGYLCIDVLTDDFAFIL